jgi:hypothetical protein
VIVQQVGDGGDEGEVEGGQHEHGGGEEQDAYVVGRRPPHQRNVTSERL